MPFERSRRSPAKPHGVMTDKEPAEVARSLRSLWTVLRPIDQAEALPRFQRRGQRLLLDYGSLDSGPAAARPGDFILPRNGCLLARFEEFIVRQVKMLLAAPFRILPPQLEYPLTVRQENDSDFGAVPIRRAIPDGTVTVSGACSAPLTCFREVLSNLVAPDEL